MLTAAAGAGAVRNDVNRTGPRELATRHIVNVARNVSVSPVHELSSLRVTNRVFSSGPEARRHPTGLPGQLLN